MQSVPPDSFSVFNNEIARLLRDWITASTRAMISTMVVIVAASAAGKSVVGGGGRVIVDDCGDAENLTGDQFRDLNDATILLSTRTLC